MCGEVAQSEKHGLLKTHPPRLAFHGVLPILAVFLADLMAPYRILLCLGACWRPALPLGQKRGSQEKGRQQTIFYDFSLYDPVGNPDTNHRIQACSSFNPDFDNIPSESVAAKLVESASSVDVEFELGWWHKGFSLAKAAIRSLIEQIRKYIDYGHGTSDRPFILYSRPLALRTFQDNFDTLDVTTPSLAIQLYGSNYDSTQIFGVAVTSNATFAPIQNTIKSWVNTTCLSFLGSKNFPGKATFTTPLLNGTLTNSTVRARHNTHAKSFDTHAKVFDTRTKFLQARGDCRTMQVASGKSYTELTAKYGSSGANFTKYNPGIYGSLKPKQHMYCSSGSLPDFRPKPNPDGSYFSYKVQNDDNCANLGAEYGLTNEDIEGFNKNMWGWSGCKLLFAETIMCLSTGKPPFPGPIANAVCGPQKPGSKPPTDCSNIADLNPCPLNACCNIWGQYGVTKDFCVNTNTGPPGTAGPGTYGCISNCGVDVIKGPGTGAIKLAYFQNYGMNRKCLYQDALAIRYLYGPNYLAFLAVLKNLLPGKTVAIAAPRIVLDAHNQYFQEGCDTGNCLRSQVNLTKTRQALAMITKAGVPGNKTVVGVTGYGRSAGYIADAKINEIMRGGSGAKRQSRVATHFLDPGNNSDILVYDNNQWVKYITENTKRICLTLYANLGMAGITDWASNLQEFHNPPKPAKDWAFFIALAASKNNPKKDTTTIGNWGTFTCTADVIENPGNHPNHMNFINHRPLPRTDIVREGADGEKSGPAAQFILNSLIKIHIIHHTYWDALRGMMGTFAPRVDDMEDTGVLKQLPAFANPVTYGNAKDTTLNLIGQTTMLAKDILKKSCARLMDSAGTKQIIQLPRPGYLRLNKYHGTRLGKLFDGTQESIKSNVLKSFFGFSIPTLWRRSKAYAFAIDSGANCDGRPLGKYLDDSTTDKTGVCYQGKCYYLVHPDGEARPCKCERMSNLGPCQTVCRNNKFSVPVGLGDLGRFSGVTKEDLVIGSVRTWLQNGKINGGGVTDPINNGAARADLLNMDITTPGLVRLPVCSPDRAFQSWETATEGGSDNHPCDIPPVKDRCGPSTFEDRTSDASPSVSDCLQIIRNIEGDALLAGVGKCDGNIQTNENRTMRRMASPRGPLPVSRTLGSVPFVSSVPRGKGHTFFC
ncbi:hypothetical protein DL766_004935 [Monosporascus sp. MC13-8B]|uniref:LysM domain-containing protein n=1 Tax=Monosporascus cannonballus TaxID=155416 RepID=A0ABY0GUQ1_9PEZI|nr:hypothetical protein DL762_009218 [Monosporascus cannonballus]RYP30263.1 hypothetical protein DL766_004935 [Monosporascus sp. MC13-8B]